MKKTLALVLALVMVCSVLAMIPASAAETKVLGWEALSDCTIKAVGTDKVQMDAQGYYTSAQGTAGVMISEKPVDISKGFTLSISNLTGFYGNSDEWVIIGFMDKKAVFQAGTKVNSGALLHIQPNQYQFYTRTLGPNANASGFEEWGAANAFSNVFATPSAVASGTYAWEVKVVNSDGTHYLAIGDAGASQLSLHPGSIASHRIAAVDECLDALGTEAYVFVALSQKNSDESMNKTSITVNALEVANPGTGDIFTIYAAVAAISVAVVGTAVVVLRKKEEQF